MKKRILLVVISVLLAVGSFGFAVANAEFTIRQSGVNWLMDDVSPYTTYFYRTTTSDNVFNYGYGYGNNVATPTYAYGYGYGYAYSYFAYAYDYGWGTSDSRLGYFIAANDVTDTSNPGTSFMVPATAGVATVPIAMTFTTTGLSNVVVKVPSGLVMTDASGLWDGSLTMTGTSSATIPSDLSGSLSSAVAVTVNTGGYAITLSLPIIVKIPYAGFDGVTDKTVAMVDGGGTASTISACTTSQLPAANADSDSELLDYSNYTLAAGSACYSYLSNYVYVATMHLSSFYAGVGVSASSPGAGGPVGGSSSSKDKKKVAVKEEKAEEKAVEKVVEYTDLVGLKTDDWRYAAIKAVLDAGLFSGEMKNGKKVFNMNNTMNRAQAAQVVATYFGCPAATLTEAPFTDVAKDVWYANAVSCLKTNNIVGGKTALLFAPSDTVARAEFFRMLVEAYLAKNPTLKTEWEGLMKTGTDAFVDVDAKVWYAPYMRLAYSKGLLSGYDIGGKKYVKAGNGIIRVEGAVMVMKFLGL